METRYFNQIEIENFIYLFIYLFIVSLSLTKLLVKPCALLIILTHLLINFYYLQ